MIKAAISAFILGLSISLSAAPAARAEPIDAAAIGCTVLNNRVSAGDEAFTNALLNWMGGYHATEKQGTVVEWSKLSTAFDQTIAFCNENPNVGIMSASEKFMGEAIEDMGPASFDLAIVTCTDVQSKSSVLKDLGDTLMWLAGYHTSMHENDSTMIDLETFVKQAGEIDTYCTANPTVSLVTASEKYMAE